MLIKKNSVLLIKLSPFLALACICLWMITGRVINDLTYHPQREISGFQHSIPSRSLNVHNLTSQHTGTDPVYAGVRQGTNNVYATVRNTIFDGGGIQPDFNITTEPVKIDRIFYNRIPKCGSTTLKYIFKTVGRTNGINVVASMVYAKEVLHDRDALDFIQEFASLPTPLLYDRHVNMVHFDTMHWIATEMPAYINVVREPLDRMISDYYFKRFQRSKMFPLDEVTKNRTFETCVLGNYSECVAGTPKGYFRIIPYFCGMDKRCRVSSQWALDRAKLHVTRYYQVVGFTEDLEGFVRVLEKIFPSYFMGIYDVFSSSNKLLKERNETKKKILPSEEAVNIMKTKMGYDYEFYHFIKQRFYYQKLQLKLKTIV